MADKYVATTGNDGTGDGSSGNPWATPGYGASQIADGDTLWIKAGTYTLSNTTPNTAGGPINVTGVSCRIEGYQTSIGDRGTKPVIDVGAQTTVTVVGANNNSTSRGIMIANIEVDGQSGANVDGFGQTGSTSQVVFVACKATDCGRYGFSGSAAGTSLAASMKCSGCEAVGSGSHGFYNNILAYRCSSHGNTGGGYRFCAVIDSLAYSNGGSGFVDLFNLIALGCTAGDNTGDGFEDERSSCFIDCISSNNSGYGYKFDTGGEYGIIDNCYTYSNSSGQTNGGGGGGDILGIAPTELAADPWGAAGDYEPNTAATGGALLRGTATIIPGQTDDNPDIGAVQHADPAGGGGIWMPRARQVGV